MKRRVDPDYIRRFERELGIDDSPDPLEADFAGVTGETDVVFGPGTVIPVNGDPRHIYPFGFPAPTVLVHAEHVRRLAQG